MVFDYIKLTMVKSSLSKASTEDLRSPSCYDSIHVVNRYRSSDNHVTNHYFPLLPEAFGSLSLPELRLDASCLPPSRGQSSPPINRISSVQFRHLPCLLEDSMLLNPGQLALKADCWLQRNLAWISLLQPQPA